MSHIENTTYICKETPDPDFLGINQSPVLDELAGKLQATYIQEICDVYGPKEGKSKARIVELLSAMAGVYKLMQTNAVTPRPIFLVMDHYDAENANGFWFFRGTEEEVKAKLLKLSEERYKLKENKYW